MTLMSTALTAIITTSLMPPFLKWYLFFIKRGSSRLTIYYLMQGMGIEADDPRVMRDFRQKQKGYTEGDLMAERLG